jgi:uncharacterized protein (DUF1778 family)
MTMTASRKSDVIQIRVSAETKALFNQAASLRGQRLSEFMVASAREKAEDAILDQRVFFLSEEDHAAFLKLLDSPPAMSLEARARLSRKPLWDK